MKDIVYCDKGSAIVSRIKLTKILLTHDFRLQLLLLSLSEGMQNVKFGVVCGVL